MEISMSNYACTIVRLGPVLPHPNADRLKITSIFHNNVIVGMDAKEGDLGVFFPLECQLSEEFCAANDLIRRKDENGKPAGGMFEKNRRVRAQVLRGQKSMGFWCPISYLNKLVPDRQFNEGDSFEEIGGIPICKKFVVPSNVQVGKKEGKKEGKQVKKVSRLIPDQFRLHYDTAHLGRNLHKISPESVIGITWKLHGCQHTMARVLVKRPLSLLEKVCKWLGGSVQESEYDVLTASRRVVKNDSTSGPGFYKKDIWTEATKPHAHKLRPGETVYSELVGYVEGDSFIQKGYDYGCKPGESKLYIYRITNTDAEGNVIELTWPQVEARAAELGIPTCPGIYWGLASNFFEWDGQGTWEEALFKHLSENYVYDQDSVYCQNKVPEEGIVLRLETGLGVEAFKYKSFAFLKHEGVLLDEGVADIESVDVGEGEPSAA